MQGEQTETEFGPEYIHTINFGNPPRNSVPAGLVPKKEIDDLLSATEKYSDVKQSIMMTNGEIYRYLRLGVSTQSAMCLKYLGYPTPESLTESPKTARLLPDHLARNGVEYPLEFIDRCEEQGISALHCQIALRRGLSTVHLQGHLDERELINLFSRYVKKPVTPSQGGDQQPSLVNYVCDGTLPVHLLEGKEVLPTPGLLGVTRSIIMADPDSEVTQALLGSREKFVRFVRIVNGSSGSPMRVSESLRDLMIQYGEKVLELQEPFLCEREVTTGGAVAPMGFECAKFIHDLAGTEIREHDLQYLRFKKGSGGIRISNGWREPGVQISYDELSLMHKSGIEPTTAYRYLVEDKLSPASLIAAREDGVISTLMGGAL